MIPFLVLVVVVVVVVVVESVCVGGGGVLVVGFVQLLQFRHWSCKLDQGSIVAGFVLSRQSNLFYRSNPLFLNYW